MGEWRCDGYSGCPDNLGEAAGCLKCASNEFKCESILNPKCISLSWKCDGEDDCGNGSDELNCTFSSCNTDQFTCNTSGYETTVLSFPELLITNWKLMLGLIKVFKINAT